MSNSSLVAAILLLAGKGERFNSALPKQFHRLNGKRIYLYTLENLLSSKLFHEIILVVPDAWKEEVFNETKQSGYPFVKIITGGKTRQESSYLGIQQLSSVCSHVLIHDGVRPFVSLRILKENVDKAFLYKAVDTCIATNDTIVQSVDGQTIDHIPDRKEFLRGQTPQTFEVSLIKKAHEKALEEHFQATCDCSLVTRLEAPIAIVQGEEENIKITSELDLLIAQQLLQKKVLQKTMRLEKNLSGKIFAVTGASGTIGSTIAEKLKASGAKVIPISRSSTYSADLTSSEESFWLFEKIAQEVGPLDGLINCVGSLICKPFENYSIEEIEHLIRVNFISVLYSCKFAKIKPQGHIINFSSSSYIQGRKDMAPYSAAKAAIVNFSEALAEERKDLFINVIAPKRTLSKMRKKEFGEENNKELLEPSFIADKTVELLLSSQISGQLIKLL